MEKKIIENLAIIILAAGKGTRMKSDKAKVLHEINGRPMIEYVVSTSTKVAGENIIVVIGHQADSVKEIVLKNFNVIFAYQEKQLGTGHATMCAMNELSEHIENVIILCGDVPLIRHETIYNLFKEHTDRNQDMTLLCARIKDPTGYGRLVFDNNGNIKKIVEESDVNQHEKKINIINAGIYCVKKKYLNDCLKKIKFDNAQGELYLTDIVEILYKLDKRIGFSECLDASEVVGVNNIDELHKPGALIESRKRNMP